MSDEKKIHIGEGVLRPGTRPIEVHVDDNGDYWVCDAGTKVEPGGDPKAKGCTSYGEIHMAEGG